MTREKIISLARECGIHYHLATYPCINFEMFSDFYKLVQSEAFETAAKLCDEEHAGRLAEKIREMAKGQGNFKFNEVTSEDIDALLDDYAEDNPNTTDWRKKPHTIVEVL